MRRPPTVALAALALVVGVTGLSVGALAAGGDGGGGRGGDDDGGSSGAEASVSPAAEEAGRRFLDDYVDDDGRVVRRDQGDDTVSEGQAYAMQVAVALGDRERFDAVWAWAEDNLAQDTGLLAWRWADGAVADPSSAADADLDAAHALLLAAERFDDAGYRDDAVALGEAVLAHETVTGPDGAPVLVAGPWARQDQPILNPSYVAPIAYDLLGEATGDPRWEQLAAGGIAQLERVTEGGTVLPPDWARLHPDGSVVAAPAPGQGEVRYGYDAFRVLPRTATACREDGQDLAARLWGPVARTADERAESHRLDGSPDRPGSSPVLLVAAASAAAAAGEPDRADALLDEADEAQRQGPTYYLGAWVALGRLMLEGGGALGGCAPGDPTGAGPAPEAPSSATTTTPPATGADLAAGPAPDAAGGEGGCPAQPEVLSGRALIGEDLTDRDMRCADLSGSDLSDVDLSGVELAGARITGSNLSGADLTEANLSDADLSGTTLEGADLSGADLAVANLSGANLTDVDLTGANLAVANLSGAVLEGATVEDVSWARATCPDGRPAGAECAM